MTTESGVLVVQTQWIEGEEHLFDAWYDDTHIPEALGTLEEIGFQSARRFKRIGSVGVGEDWSQCLVLYEIRTSDMEQTCADFVEIQRQGRLPSGNAAVKPPVRFAFFTEVTNHSVLP
jgi:hypothetical protein